MRNLENSLIVQFSTAGISVTTGVLGLDAPSVTANGDGTYAFAFKFGATTGGVIYLNGNFFPDVIKKDISVGDRMFSILDLANSAWSTNLSAEQFSAVALPHELSHIAGRPDDSNNLAASNAFNQQIIATCLK